MATIYWTGGAVPADGDWMNGNNWTGGVVPADDDVVIFDRRSAESVTQGLLDSESGLSTKGGHALVHFKSGYTGDVGSTAEPWCTHAKMIIIEGPGTYHILCGMDNQLEDAVIEGVVVLNPEAHVYLYSNVNDADHMAYFRRLYIIQCADVTAMQYTQDVMPFGCYIEHAVLAPLGNLQQNATLYMDETCWPEKSGFWPTNLIMRNGTVVTDAALHLVVQFDGLVTQGTAREEFLDPEPYIDDLVSFGGLCEVNAKAESDAAVYGLLLLGGTLDMSADVNADSPRGIGLGGRCAIFIGENSVLNIATGYSNVGIGSAEYVLNAGGTIVTDLYQKTVKSGLEVGLDLNYNLE